MTRIVSFDEYTEQSVWGAIWEKVVSVFTGEPTTNELWDAQQEQYRRNVEEQYRDLFVRFQEQYKNVDHELVPAFDPRQPTIPTSYVPPSPSVAKDTPKETSLPLEWCDGSRLGLRMIDGKCQIDTTTSPFVPTSGLGATESKISAAEAVLLTAVGAGAIYLMWDRRK